MNKIAQYLSEQLDGDVFSSPDMIENFSSDASIFKIAAEAIVFPRSESDLRKLAKFSWQLAEKGRIVPLTARGLGSDYSGAAIGRGLVINLSANYKNLLILDPNKGLGTVQAGANYGSLQQMLMTHGYYLPVAPDSADYSTIGGAVANNASGRRGQKYGSTKNYISSMRFVLADGEVIETGILNQKQLAKKKGLATFEGEIYRQIDEILISNFELINKTRPDLNLNNSGYDIWGVKDEAGNFDLTRLIVGSQGTLGLISEVSFLAEPFSTDNSLIVTQFDDEQRLTEAVNALNKLNPSSIELINSYALEQIRLNKSKFVDQLVGNQSPPYLLLIEFDDTKNLKRKTKKAQAILAGLSFKSEVIEDQFTKDDYWQLRDLASYSYINNESGLRGLPIIGDGVIPPAKLGEYIKNYYLICDHFGLDKSLWGHAGIANLQSLALLDLPRDHQKISEVMKAYYRMVTLLGGSISGQFNDGRIRAPYLPLMYGDQLTEIFVQIKKLFDPYNYFNPGVKLGAQLPDLADLLDGEYNLAKFSSYITKS